MRRIEKTILWFVAVCVFGFWGGRLLIVEAPDAAAQPAHADQSEVTEPTTPPNPIASAATAADPVEFLADDAVDSSPVPVASPAGDVRKYQIRSGDVQDITNVLGVLFSAKAGIVMDERTQSVIVRAPIDVQAEIRELIIALDHAPTVLLQHITAHLTIPSQADQSLAREFMRNNQKQIDTWMHKLREAQSDDDKQAARAALRQLLATIFAEDMQARELQAQEIEARLGKLREKYKEREKVKDEIIELQLQVLEQEAEGLGFPRVGTTSRWVPRAQNLPGIVDPHDATSTEDPPLIPLKSFVTSPDGQLFAYVHANETSGPPEIRVYNTITGKLLTTAKAEKTVGPLQFTDQGVYTREADGSLKLRIEWKKIKGPQGPLYEVGGEGAPAPVSRQTPSSRSPSASAVTEPPASSSRENVFSDFKLLRDQYVGAKAELQRAEQAWNAHVAKAQENNPDSTLEDVKKEFAKQWRSVEDARNYFADAERVYNAKLQLLRIERESADAAYSAAKNTLVRLKSFYEKNVVPVSEVESQQARVEAAAFEMRRVDILYELFHSIGNDNQ